MQKTIPAFVLLLIGLLPLSVQTQQNLGQNKAEMERIEAVVNRLNQAMVDRDGETLKDLTLEELSYGHSGGAVENKEAFVEAVVNGDFDFIATSTENQSISFSGNDTAVVRHLFLIDAINKGEKVHIRIGNMMVLKKQKNQWKLLARQAYKL